MLMHILENTNLYYITQFNVHCMCSMYYMYVPVAYYFHTTLLPRNELSDSKKLIPNHTYSE